MSRRLAFAVTTLSLVALATTAVVAQSDVVKQREALMKEYGKATKAAGGMLRGAAPFDLATVQATLALYVKNAKELKPLFPEGSGEGTDALPAIWEKKAEFDGLLDKLATDADAARATITDEASFKANFPTVIRTCGTCHDSFRKKS
ncbi:c-type cytochrome [Ancylobacter pratisalsi]|uniref:Cytochrome c n=1 Tax=Ancylobacter pratisalsi TaxID=1745854 RepID=A0A6P1YUW4_9HYPH|nr:cytochrome c [Ancylobacter pratisalsi]QIB35404.1 cytochrome c [Ancylobacter pratisalsi]